MTGGLFLKDPSAQLDYGIDWTATLPADVGIAASDWLVQPAEPGGVAVKYAAVAGCEATVCLWGGIAGRVYRVFNQVRFTDGNEDERMLVLRVEDR